MEFFGIRAGARSSHWWAAPAELRYLPANCSWI